MEVPQPSSPTPLLSNVPPGKPALDPWLLVTYHGLAGSGISLVAFSDGSVLLEQGSSEQERLGHIYERFGSFGEASEALSLPLYLPAGDVMLRIDPTCCCPTYQVFRFPSQVPGGLASELACSPSQRAKNSVVVTRVRYGFSGDEPTRCANDFRTFTLKVAAYERRLARATKSLASRLNLSEEAFAYASSVEGLATVEERLSLLGLSRRCGEDCDDEWPLEVQKTIDEIIARLKGGNLTPHVLREVLCRRPQGARLLDTVDLKGWELALEASSTYSGPGFAGLSRWLSERAHRVSVMEL